MKLIRDDANDARTLGAIFLDSGVRFCDTLELPWRGNQHNVSCIPEGTYEVKLQFSPVHGRNLYWLQDVPGRGAIEIHVGNTVVDSKGCILLGCSRKGDAVVSSRLAFGKFMRQMEGENFTLEITKKESA
jgi:hypothetical protein